MGQYEDEEFDVSEACREKLKSAGAVTVDDLVTFFQNIKNATFIISWGECVEEVVDELKRIGRLPEDYPDW